MLCRHCLSDAFPSGQQLCGRRASRLVGIARIEQQLAVPYCLYVQAQTSQHTYNSMSLGRALNIFKPREVLGHGVVCEAMSA